MNLDKKINYYLEILKTPNKAIGATKIIKSQERRVIALEKAKINPNLRFDIRNKSLMIELDGEWLDLSSPANCLRYSIVVLKYPEYYKESW